MEHEQHIPVSTYLVVFIALLVLLFASVGLAFIPTKHHVVRDLLTVVGFTIAGIKTVLIILWFMHVKVSSKMTWVFASAAFVWLGLLVGLTLTDYLARPQPPSESSQIAGVAR